MYTIQRLYPNWRELSIHESSPSKGGASAKLKAECPRYISSQFNPPDDSRHEDLEAQTFPDSSFDIVITQDVFEHLFRPDRAIAEIVRTLRRGGAHIMSVPIVRKDSPTRQRATMVQGEITYLTKPEYHGNPIDPNGSLVTFDWGYDIADLLEEHGGPTSIEGIDDLSMGMTAEFMEIVITTKRF